LCAADVGHADVAAAAAAAVTDAETEAAAAVSTSQAAKSYARSALIANVVVM
jgi:hypothetical protein